MKKQLTKYVRISFLLSIFILILCPVSAQTYKNGVWYSLYDESEHEMNTQGDYETTLFAPTGGKLVVKWRYEWIDWLGVAKKIDTEVLESANGGTDSKSVGQLAENTSNASNTTENFTVSDNINWLKFNREGLPTHKVILYHLSVPLAQHIRLASGTYGTTSASYDFGELNTTVVSEPYQIKLRSFLSADDITVTCSEPDIFRLGTESNTQPLVFEVGANACASANGKAVEPAEGVLANIANYSIPVYFIPQDSKAYEAVITITDGTSTATFTVTGTGKKKSQFILWEQKTTFYSSATIEQATASSGLPVEYDITPEGIVSYSDNVFTILTAGTVQITASQPGNEVYSAAEPVIKTFTILPAETRYEYEAAVCPGDFWSDELFKNISEAGQYYDTLTNVYGSDSVICLTLTHYPVYAFDEYKTIYVGAEETWQEKDLSACAVGETTLVAEYSTIHGCDSVFTLHLTVESLPVTYGEQVIEICEGETAEYEDKTYDKPIKESVLLSLKNTLGGDSVVELTVIVHPAFASETELTIMQGEQRIWQGKDLSQLSLGETTLVAEYSSVYGCDSVFTLHLNVIERPATYGTETIDLCEGERINYEGQFYDKPTKETVLVSEKNQYGGDSVVTLIVNVYPVFASVEEMTINKGAKITWQDRDLSTYPVGESTVEAKYTSVHGCDSTYVLRLTVQALPTTYGADTLNICSGETGTYEGKTYKRQTVDSVLVSEKNSLGGDSVVVLVVYVRPVMHLSADKSITIGDAVEWQNIDLSLLPVGDTTLVAEYTSVYGCDSTYVLHLTVKPKVGTGVEQSPITNHQSPIKLFLDGRLYIRKGDDLYDLTGRKVE